jgi:hypothetical protein
MRLSNRIYFHTQRESFSKIHYHTIGRYLALPAGSIRAGQNSPYFDNYMQESKYGPGKYESIFARLLFPNLFRRRLPSGADTP